MTAPPTTPPPFGRLETPSLPKAKRGHIRQLLEGAARRCSARGCGTCLLAWCRLRCVAFGCAKGREWVVQARMRTEDMFETLVGIEQMELDGRQPRGASVAMP